MTKIKISAQSTGGGSIDLKCYTAFETESNRLVKFENISTEISYVLNVTPGTTIKPIFNYYGGNSADGVLTIKVEGSSDINKLDAVATIPAYTG